VYQVATNLPKLSKYQKQFLFGQLSFFSGYGKSVLEMNVLVIYFLNYEIVSLLNFYFSFRFVQVANLEFCSAHVMRIQAAFILNSIGRKLQIRD